MTRATGFLLALWRRRSLRSEPQHHGTNVSEQYTVRIVLFRGRGIACAEGEQQRWQLKAIADGYRVPPRDEPSFAFRQL